MISAALKALGDVLSPEFRSILLKAVGLTIVLFILVIAGALMVLELLGLVPWGWVETIIEVAAGLGLAVLAFFLMAPVTALFAGLYLDKVARIVEERHYPQDPIGEELSMFEAITTGIQFGLLALLINIAILPAIFFAIGAVVLVIANAYLISREFFVMVAARHMPLSDARAMRKANSPRILVAGLIPALLALIPIANLLVPLFSTAYFVHIYKRIRASSP
jgi:CysZ protein